MGRWSSKDLRLWLTGVLEARGKQREPETGTESEAETGVCVGMTPAAAVCVALHVALVDRVIDQVDEASSSKQEQGQGQTQVPGRGAGAVDKKRKYTDATPSFFGSTTMSHRNKKFYVGGGRSTSGGVAAAGGGVSSSVAKSKLGSSSGGSNGGGSGGGRGVSAAGEASVTSGQVFMRLNLEAVLGGNALLGSSASANNGLEDVTVDQLNAVIADIRSAMKRR